MQNNGERIKSILSPMTRQSLSAILMNFISTIPDNEEIEILFEQEEKKGISHIYLDVIRKSRTPDIEKTVVLTANNLDVKVSSGSSGKSKTGSDKKGT